MLQSVQYFADAQEFYTLIYYHDHSKICRMLAQPALLKSQPRRLRFLEPMESAYRREFDHKTLKLVRINILLGAMFFGVYGFVERVLFDGASNITFLIRITVFVPLATFVFFFSFSRVFAKFRNPSLALLFAVAGCSRALIMVMLPASNGYTQFSGILLVLLFGYTLGTISCRWASIAGWSIVIFYNAAIIISNKADPINLLGNNMVLNMTNIAGMLAAYILEYVTRQDFLSRWELAVEKEKVLRLNEELERRVDERTVQLSQVNVELEHLAHQDHLTGIGNSRLLEKEIERLIKSGTNQDFGFALVIADIDRFKEVNDVLGHRDGDEVLRITAQRIRKELEPGSPLVRLGGAEFVFVLSNSTTRTTIQPVLERISRCVARPIVLQGHTAQLTLCFGVGVFPNDAVDYIQLIRCADTAISEAKSIGRSVIQYYSQELGEKTFHRMQIERSLRTALEYNEFTLNYQGKFNTKTGEIEGVETLLRWNSVALGVVGPDLFVPIAEESGTIQAIDEWVLRTACLETRELFLRAPNAGGRCCLSVNVSANHFCDSGFVARVSEIVAATGFPVHRLQFEVTESAIMHEPDSARQNILKLRNQGIKISIDDFGTGHSSLAYLSRFPIDELKIDRAFVAQLVSSSEDKAIIQTIIALGLALGARVVAEGVESEEQRKILNRCSCHLVQGYLYSRPEPIERLRRRLEE